MVGTLDEFIELMVCPAALASTMLHRRRPPPPAIRLDRLASLRSILTSWGFLAFSPRISPSPSHLIPLCARRRWQTYVRSGEKAAIPYSTRPIHQVNDAIADLRDGKITGRCVLCHEQPAAPKI